MATEMTEAELAAKAAAEYEKYIDRFIPAQEEGESDEEFAQRVDSARQRLKAEGSQGLVILRNFQEHFYN